MTAISSPGGLVPRLSRGGEVPVKAGSVGEPGGAEPGPTIIDEELDLGSPGPAPA